MNADAEAQVMNHARHAIRALLGCMIALLVACTDEPLSRAEQLQLARNAGVQVPADATALVVSAEAVFVKWTYIQFEISHDQLDAFLANHPALPSLTDDAHPATESADALFAPRKSLPGWGVDLHRAIAVRSRSLADPQYLREIHLCLSEAESGRLQLNLVISEERNTAGEAPSAVDPI